MKVKEREKKKVCVLYRSDILAERRQRMGWSSLATYRGKGESLRGREGEREGERETETETETERETDRQSEREKEGGEG